jgi:hypothetical protein
MKRLKVRMTLSVPQRLCILVHVWHKVGNSAGMSAVFLCPKKIKMKPKKSYIAGAEVYISSRPKRTFDWNSIWNSQVKSGNRSGSSVEKAPNTHEICTKIPEYGYHFPFSIFWETGEFFNTLFVLNVLPLCHPNYPTHPSAKLEQPKKNQLTSKHFSFRISYCSSILKIAVTVLWAINIWYHSINEFNDHDNHIVWIKLNLSIEIK